MTKSIEEIAKECSKTEWNNWIGLKIEDEPITRACIASLKARDDQWSAVVNELRDSLSKILPEVYCLYQQETGLRLDKLDEKYDTVKIKYDRSKSALTKADQMLKEMGISNE